MQQLLSSLEDERQRQFRRFVGISAAIHAVAALLMWIGPIRHSPSNLPVVERVQLVEALAPAARPAPARPAPAKPKPPPPPAKKVLPKEPAPLPKPEPVKAKPKPEPKLEPKPEPKPKEEPAPEQDYEDVLDQLRKEAGETTPAPVEQAAAPATAGGPVGGPGIVDPELARWQREVKILVTRAWIVPAGFRNEALIAEIEVELSATGEVLGTRKTKSSGNPWFDESVERAIEKASPLPAPPDPGEWPFTFDSREMQ
jgi:colicin import membrane protein